MAKKQKPPEQKEFLPFNDLPESIPQGIKITLDPLRYPIWTENKAKLIERYLYYFVLITRHGAYIDGFAGPQEPDKPEMWAANLVLNSEPRLLRHIYLCDKFKQQYEALETLKANQPERDKKGRKLYREIEVLKGDFNVLVHQVLGANKIKDTEATFCLLDQRTFECHWATVEALATYKKSGRKFEIFYFLPIAWLDRALAAQKQTKVLADWWGRDDWVDLRKMSTQSRVDTYVDRFKNELGYASVMAWPIFKRQNIGNIMYYMIHATDHPAAPRLMYRAYHEAINPKESPREVQMEFADLIKELSEDEE